MRGNKSFTKGTNGLPNMIEDDLLNITFYRVENGIALLALRKQDDDAIFILDAHRIK